MQRFLQFVALEESYINFGDYNLEQKFHHYNTLLFKSEIPAIPVVWTDNLKNGSKTAAGLTTFSYTGRTYAPGTMKIEINTRFKRTEENLDSTLIHEMIHAFLIVCGYPQENHGFRFLTIAHAVEQKLGIKIAVTDDLTDLELTNETFTSTTVLLRKGHREWTAIFYSGTAFDDPKQQDALKSFWGIPGRLPGNEEILVIKIQSNLLAKYGGARAVKQTAFHIISETEANDILRRGQIMFKITSGMVSHEFATANLPTKETLVALRTNTRTNETIGTLYVPAIAHDGAKLQVVKEKWHSWYAAGYNVEIFLTTSILFNRGFKMQRDPNKSPYYIFKPDSVAELRQHAKYLERWHQ